MFKKIILAAILTLGLGASFTLAQSTDNTNNRYAGFCSVNSFIIRGNLDQRVRDLQFLIKQQYFFGQGVTGFYGALTERNVRAVQRTLGINPSGAIGPITLARLKSIWCNGGTVTNPVNNNTPIISISPISSSGNSVTINWTSTNANSCSINGENVGISGNKTYTIYNETNYKIICVNGNGVSSEKTLLVRPDGIVNNITPTVSLSINPTTLTVGQYANLSWTSTNANVCLLNGNTVSLNGNQSIYISSNSQSYNLNCTGSGGSAGQSITATGGGIVTPVNQINNINTFTGSYKTVNQLAELTWTGTGPNNSCSLYRVTAVNSNDSLDTSSPSILITSNLATNVTNYLTPFVATVGRFDKPRSVFKLNCGDKSLFVNVSKEEIPTNSGSVTTSGIYQTGNQINVNWTIPTAYQSEAQGVRLLLVDISNNQTVASIARLPGSIGNNLTGDFRGGSINFIIPQGNSNPDSDVKDGRCFPTFTSTCPNVLKSGNYKVVATYFTPSNACLGFCLNVAGQKVLGSVSSGNFFINSTVVDPSKAVISTINTFTGNYKLISGAEYTELNWTGTGPNNSCSLYRVVAVNSSNILSVNLPGELIASNLSVNQTNYITPYILTSALNISGSSAAGYKLICGDQSKVLGITKTSSR